MNIEHDVHWCAFQKLNDDTLIAIFSFLDVQDILVLRRVIRLLYIPSS